MLHDRSPIYTPRRIAFAAFVAAICAGGYSYARLPGDAYPDGRHSPAVWLLGSQPVLPQAFVRRQQSHAVAQIVADEARAHGVPVALALAVAHVESGLRPSHAVTGPQTRYGRAVGSMQILPSTGRAMGCGNLRDTRQNVRCGVRYLRASLDRNGGDAGIAALEYHGGTNRRIWGPRTLRYREMVLARIGGQAGRAPHVGRSGDNSHFERWWLTR